MLTTCQDIGVVLMVCWGIRPVTPTLTVLSSCTSTDPDSDKDMCSRAHCWACHNFPGVLPEGLAGKARCEHTCNASATQGRQP